MALFTYHCGFCGKGFPSTVQLKRHMKYECLDRKRPKDQPKRPPLQLRPVKDEPKTPSPKWRKVTDEGDISTSASFPTGLKRSTTEGSGTSDT